MIMHGNKEKPFMRVVNHFSQVLIAFLLVWICALQSFRSQYRHVALPTDLPCMINDRLRESSLWLPIKEGPPTEWAIRVLNSERDGPTSGRGRADGGGRRPCIGKRC